MNKIKGLDNWVESYNQPPDTTKYIMKKPKYVYLVLINLKETIQIAGCFYSKEAAQRYSDGDARTVIQKLSVI